MNGAPSGSTMESTTSPVAMSRLKNAPMFVSDSQRYFASGVSMPMPCGRYPTVGIARSTTTRGAHCRAVRVGPRRRVGDFPVNDSGSWCEVLLDRLAGLRVGANDL